MRRTLSWIVGIAAMGAPAFARAAEPPRFEWKDGDRVVLVGDTLIERNQSYGYLETLVTAQNPGRTIRFRNLGWSADTVLGLSRAGFGNPEEGFRQLKEHVLAIKPTALVVGYGMAESFGGEANLPAFVSGLNTLLDTFAPLKARLVLLSPITHEDLGRPLPDPSKHNQDLARYRDAIRTIARERGAWFVDLLALRAGDGTKTAVPYHLTDNGIHLNAYGYWRLSAALGLGLNLHGARPWDVTLDVTPTATADGPVRSSPRVLGTALSNVLRSPGGVRFEALDEQLPTSPAPPGTPAALIPGDRRLRVRGLEPGVYALKVDGKPVERASAERWAQGVWLDRGPERDQVERLRTAVNAKNRLYLYRWRPQNETYLFGFRKHEQGNNAREIPLFDPLVEAKEEEIARLKLLVPHVYELTRGKESEVAR